MNRPKTTQTFRAGQNTRDPTRSAYARVDVLGQEDLFPNEGRDFPIRAVPKQTKSYQISADSPFSTAVPVSMVPESEEQKVLNQNYQEIMRTERMCTRAAAKTNAATCPGELRPLYSQIAAQCIRKDQEAQMRVREQIRLARMKEECRWEDVEQIETQSTRRVQTAIASSRRARQQELADSYKRELTLHEIKRQEEIDEEQREAEEIQRLLQEENKREQARQEKIRKENAERTRDFQLLNSELMMRHETRIEQEIAEEARIAKEHAEIEARMDAREAANQRRRDELNARRAKIIGDQSRRLAELKKRQKQKDTIAESKLAKREEARRQADIERRRQMAIQRNREYNEYKREKELKMQEDPEDDTKQEPDYEEEARRVDEEMRMQKRRQVMLQQRAQIEQRRMREQKEREAARRNPDKMFFLKDEDL